MQPPNNSDIFFSYTVNIDGNLLIDILTLRSELLFLLEIIENNPVDTR